MCWRLPFEPNSMWPLLLAMLGSHLKAGFGTCTLFLKYCCSTVSDKLTDISPDSAAPDSPEPRSVLCWLVFASCMYKLNLLLWLFFLQSNNTANHLLLAIDARCYAAVPHIPACILDIWTRFQIAPQRYVQYTCREWRSISVPVRQCIFYEI